MQTFETVASTIEVRAEVAVGNEREEGKSVAPIHGCIIKLL